MAPRGQAPHWEQAGTQATVPAGNPSAFLAQHVSPLFYRRTEPSAGEHEQFSTDRAFWEMSARLPLASVCLHHFRVTDWFPRSPGVYWSDHGCFAREYSWADTATVDPELGTIVSPRSKMALIEDGGIGTIRLCPRRIDNTDCWLATGVTGEQCAGGVPLAVPDFFIRGSRIEWGDQVNIYGQVRFLCDAGLDDVAAYVHHASPLIIFVDAIEGVSKGKLAERMTLTPVALFDQPSAVDDDDRPQARSQFGYTFVQCAAEHNRNGLDRAAGWIERYAQKHGGQVITNFDELIPTLANAPLSYQRLVAKTYDRVTVERLYLHGRLADRIERVEYNNYGLVGAMGENARSNGNEFGPSAQPQTSAGRRE